MAAPRYLGSGHLELPAAVSADRSSLASEKASELAIERRREALALLEDEVLQTAQGVVLANLAFSEVARDATDPPQEWVDKYGEPGARLRLEVAKAGWLPQAEAPSAVRLAAQVMIGITRGRGNAIRAAQQSINVKIALPAPTSREHPGESVYPSKEIDT